MSKKNIQKQSKSTIIKNKNKSSNNLKPLVKTDLFGVGVTNDYKENILEYITTFLQKSSNKMYIVTPNPEIVVRANKESDFRQVLNQAQISLPDGVGLKIASYFFGKKIKERVTGLDMMESICRVSNDWPITVGFLGGGPGVAERCAECLREKYPNLKVIFTAESIDKNEIEESKVSSINNGKQNTTIDVLFVAFGASKQEFFMAENLGKLPVRIMMGVGGAFDQIVNPSLRPPKIIDKIGLGWLYRLIRQPWRWKRQLALIEFVGLVIKEKLKS